MFLYSTLLCKKIARAPGGHERFMLTKLGGGAEQIQKSFIEHETTESVRVPGAYVSSYLLLIILFLKNSLSLADTMRSSIKTFTPPPLNLDLLRGNFWVVKSENSPHYPLILHRFTPPPQKIPP